MNPILILGKNSYVGNGFYNYIKPFKKCELVSRNRLDFLNENSFQNISYNDSNIMDFINVNNGNEEQIFDCNYWGFKSFCDYLKGNCSNFTYVYVSTISVLSEEIVNSNAYVRSKKMAEDYLINSGIKYQIIRLSYPIGKGENKNRLITRLINDLKIDKKIVVTNTLINLNSIQDVVKKIDDVLLKEKNSFISNNNYLVLSDIVAFLKEKIQSKSEIEIIEAQSQFTPLSDNPFNSSYDIYDTLLKMI